MTTEDIIEVINKEMEKQGVTIYRLAERSGVPETTVRRVVRGENSPSIDVIVKLLDGLGLVLSIEYKR